MFKKIRNNLKLFRRSRHFVLSVVLFLLGAASSIVSIFVQFALLPVISSLSLVAILVIFIAAQVRSSKFEAMGKAGPDRFRIITENMNEAVVVYTPDFQIIEFNSAAERLFGIKKSEIINQTVSPSLVNDERFNSLAQVIFPSLAPRVVQVSEKGWPQITEISTGNGMNLLSVFARVVDDNQNPTGFIKIIEDRTAEKRIAEEKLEFVTTSSQKIQNSLEEIGRVFEEIKQQAPEAAAKGTNLYRQALGTIENLLEVAKLEGNQYFYNFQKTDLSALIGEVAEKARSFAESYGISISFSPVQNMAVAADPDKIKAVLSALIDNAVKYNNEGGTVEIFAKSDGRFAEVAVSDTGIGIEPGELEKIFGKFYRTKRGSEMVPGASGLGLYIARKIIEKHGGTIRAESTSGRGSTFRFTLPLTSN